MRSAEVAHWACAVITFVAFCFVASMLTQHLWKPFVTARVEVLTQDGRQINAKIQTTVENRHPVTFRDRLVHIDSGAWYSLNEHKSLTAQTGTSTIPKVITLPDDAPTGRYCHITEYAVVYNQLNAQLGVYEPACLEVTQ